MALAESQEHVRLSTQMLEHPWQECCIKCPGGVFSDDNLVTEKIFFFFFLGKFVNLENFKFSSAAVKRHDLFAWANDATTQEVRF